ncbi:ABC transporter ATP-binding protein (plasmid) [Bacillus cereus]|uniref:ABC transporter ATP-binding protein n=1 Tax=Bacillus cereus TaxID=1396 RepID=UPI000BF4A031|nr:ABC transporter ATP-binding protein [Bacillus cereus]EKS7870170.1 ABC transporter ATP-binding protein [Bacillus cereus]PFI73656.1 ABC transporter [Bacillus cereus]PFJ60717.1 ABC transporter [Bacillus cereus]PFN40954.1 ABC transporter [Bacillus cereus]
MAKNDYTIGDHEKNSKNGRQMGGGLSPMGGRAQGQKVNNFKKTIQQLISYCKSYVPIVIFALILAFVGSAFNVYGPDKLSEMTDLIQEGIRGDIDLGAIKNIGIILVVLYGLGLVFNYIQGFIMATVTQKITKKMRTELSQKMNRIPLSYFDKMSYGNILSRVTNDVDTIGQTLNNSLGQLVTAIATFVGALIMMFYTNWIMAITGIVATLIGFILMTLIMKRSQKYFVQQQAELGKINGHIEEMYAGHHIVKAYNGEKEAKEVFHTINDRLFDNAWKSQFMSGIMMPIMQFIGNFGYVAVCIVGALLVTNGVITIGTIVAFMVYIRLFTQPLSQLAQAATNLQSTAAASERVFEFLEEEELSNESEKTMRLDNVKGDVEFKHVKFGYDKDRLIIKDFSAKVNAGQKVAIVGPTGAGKTTLVNLLMRFYELNSGEITIDGVPINQLTREHVHDLFCMVLQDTWLFEGTIRENIVYSKENVSDEEIIATCKAVGLHNTIKNLSKGYDTLLNDKANLSAGQKQLITIARAMIENAPLLILDEATSSVDTRTELLIQKAMDRLTVGKTSFVIAHRLSTIKNADLILVMKEGDILETGTHEELLAKGGFYADLYNSQFESVS